MADDTSGTQNLKQKQHTLHSMSDNVHITHAYIQAHTNTFEPAIYSKPTQQNQSNYDALRFLVNSPPKWLET